MYLLNVGKPCCGRCTTPAGSALSQEGLNSPTPICDGSLPLTMKYVVVEVSQSPDCGVINWPTNTDGRFLLTSTDGVNWTRKTSGSVTVEAVLEHTGGGYWRAESFTFTDTDTEATLVFAADGNNLYWDENESTCGDCNSRVRWWVNNTARILPAASYASHSLTLTGGGHSTLPDGTAVGFDCGAKFNQAWTLNYSHDGEVFDGWLVGGAWFGVGTNDTYATLRWGNGGGVSIDIRGAHVIYGFNLGILRKSECVTTDPEGGSWPHGFADRNYSAAVRNPCLDLSWCTCGTYTVSG